MTLHPLFRAENVWDRQLWGHTVGQSSSFSQGRFTRLMTTTWEKEGDAKKDNMGVIAGHGHGFSCAQSFCFPLHAMPCRGGHPSDILAESSLSAPHPPRLRKIWNIGIAALSTHLCGGWHSAPHPGPISRLWPEEPRHPHSSGSEGSQVSARSWPSPVAATTPCLAPGEISSHWGDLWHQAGNIDGNH